MDDEVSTLILKNLQVLSNKFIALEEKIDVLDKKCDKLKNILDDLDIRFTWLATDVIYLLTEEEKRRGNGGDKKNSQTIIQSDGITM